jgi:dihydropteroate synthase
MTFTARRRFNWKLRTRTLALGERTVLMGILNVTPDSFSDGGEFFVPAKARDRALVMLEAGAEILDLGGESTRPGARPVSAEDEQARVLPVLSAVLEARPEAIVSIDTYHASTARRALELGAEIVNDVSGLLWDAEMAEVMAEFGAGAVLMHTRGRPQDWAGLPALAPEEVLPTVMKGLERSAALALDRGVGREAMALDPGFGFGKRGTENFALHAALGRLAELGFPVLVGSSRKRFLTGGALAGAEAVLAAATASNVAAILAGAHILRVHDVAEARAAAFVADEILRAV